MTSVRLRAFSCAFLIGLTGCGGAGSDSAEGASAVALLAQKTVEQEAVLSANHATPSVEPTSSREQVVIESKVSSGDDSINPWRARSDQPAKPPAAQIRLDALPTTVSPTIKSSSANFGRGSSLDLPTQIGVGRKVAASATSQQVDAMLGWSPSQSGQTLVSAIRFMSTNAKGVRLGVKVEVLPLAAMLRFYSDDDSRVYEISSQEILSVIQRNLDSGDSSEAARTYWSPNLGGEAITLEIEVPKDTPPDSVQISVPSLAHVLTDVKKLNSVAKVGEAGSCTKDVSCSTEYNEISKSVALMDFVESDGNNYVCTGTLLNDRMSSGIPYFLSANHCISSQTVASTLYTLWFYRSATCNSTQVNSQAAVMTSGATLLYASADTDTSFMRLNSSPPAGVVYAGTSPFALDSADGVYGVSHPRGDLQKYTTGNAWGKGSCSSVSCSASAASNASFWRVTWSQGATELGSSGSGLFTKLNGKDYLVGQLFGGYGSCANPLGYEYYGRFDKAYDAALYQWLGATSGAVRVPIYRLYNRRTATHFFTASPAERDRAVEKLGAFNYEGIAFYAYISTGSANDSVYRFYNNQTGVHFYTINSGERDNVIRTLPSFSYEGTSWYAAAGPQNQSSAMFRFYNTATGTHFYTINASERDNIIRTLPGYNYEGVGYYAWLSP